MPPTILLVFGAMLLAPVGALVLVALVVGALLPRFRSFSLRALIWGLVGGLLPLVGFVAIAYLLLGSSGFAEARIEVFFIIFLAGVAPAVLLFYGLRFFHLVR